jgi:hypothetical protein
VHVVLRDSIYEVERLRKEWKHRIPMPRDIVWRMDMTGIEDTDGRTKTVLGIIDQGTRLRSRC